MNNAMKVSFLAVVLCCFIKSTQAQNTTVDDIEARLHGGGVWTTSLNATVEWEPVMMNGNMMLNFTLTGSDTGYVAVAISLDQLMGAADDCYFCSRTAPNSTNITVTSAYITQRGRPTTVELLVANVSTSIADGMITCSFYRPISVDKNVSGIVTTWNVSDTAYNLLYAEGEVGADGMLMRHPNTARTNTNGMFSLVDNTGYLSGTTMAPATTTTCSAAFLSSNVVYIFAALIFSMF